ncbi:MAG: LuxR C-terminal-related transcriptional regulator [Bacteroidales bacterium]|jgi:DNA-binding NarL/FixJ family response regulator|nr:LuxR C-terminal-related transcriptional regulator [Bacteroidales bacterium]
MDNNKLYKLVIIEPTEIIRAGLDKLFGDSYTFRVIESFETFADFKENIHKLNPDIIIINPSIIELDKQLTIKSLFHDIPQAGIVALVYSYIHSDILRQYNGIIEIDDSFNTIESTLRSAINSTEEKKDNFDNQELTDREKDVLIAVAKGWMNKEIADKLNISIHTVISHRKNISRKTGIKSVSGLTVYALINNLIDKDEMFL